MMTPNNLKSFTSQELKDAELMISNFFGSLYDHAKPQYATLLDAIQKELKNRK